MSKLSFKAFEFHLDPCAMDDVQKHMKGRRGTARRAAEFEQELFRSHYIKSSLTTLLIELWSWGKIPATLVQRIAQAARDDLTSAGYGKIREWDTLAALGSDGKLANNVHRDLLRKMPPEAMSVAW